MKSFLAFVLTLALTARADELENIFQHPPAAARPHVMWMWMGCNLTKASITKDLEALHDAGFGGTMMMSLADTTTPWPGEIGKSPTPEIVAFTEPWWELVRHTALESRRLGMDFGMASSPGYSTSGGPWITPELSMSEICFTSTPAHGPGKMELNLPQPTVDPHGTMHYPVFNPATGKVEKPVIPARKTFFRDIAVLAMPASGVVAKDQVINLTGKTEWEVPAGEWVVYRFGYTTKGILLQPPQWKANGLELDKLNPDAVNLHMDHIIGEIKKHVGDLIGKGFNFIHVDSYEAGTPEWTPRMREEFSARRGYDLTPFLATLAKRTVGSKEESEKFKNDFKETIRDLFRDVYYKTIHEKLQAAGLVFSSEPYGGEWRQGEIVPQVDRLLVEFWTKNGGINFNNPATVAAQRATGRNLIEAEAFTGSPNDSQWSEYPAWLKPIGDAAFCAGVNRLVLHRYVPQPWGDEYKPGNTMGWWGTHFDRTQTWWEHGKAMVQYWTRCQALLQWGQFTNGVEDFSAEKISGGAKISSIHRTGDGADVWFVANTARTNGTAECRFAVIGKQPELWDAVTGEMRPLTDFEQTATNTVVSLDFAPAQSYFIVFRHPVVAGDKKPNVPALASLATLDGAWSVQFDPKWGGPEKPVTFDVLDDWTKRAEPGIKYFSGTAVYRKMFDAPASALDIRNQDLFLDLGVVKHTARVRLNGRDLGVVWTAPWGVKIPADLLREHGNELEIEVANVWANRLIGDEQEPPDCEWIPGDRGNGGSLKEFPDWFLKREPRPSKGRYTFTTWNYFKKSSPLISSGLLGPVRLARLDFSEPPASPSDYLASVITQLQALWPKNRAVNIVFHGHSVPSGYFKTPAVDSLHAYPNLLRVALAEKFPHAVINVIVTAIGGENSVNGAARFERDVLTHKPDVVLIDYALNDRRIGLETARTNWISMIQKSQAAGAKVILLTPTPDQSAKLDDANDPLNQHAEQIRKLADEFHVGLVDSLAAFKSEIARGTALTNLMSQVNHPNERGHELVAGELVKWFPTSQTGVSK